MLIKKILLYFLFLSQWINVYSNNENSRLLQSSELVYDKYTINKMENGHLITTEKKTQKGKFITTYVPDTEEDISLWQSIIKNKTNIFFGALGIVSMGTLGYLGYTKYQDHQRYQKARKWIKNYFKQAMKERQVIISKYFENNKQLLVNYKKEIQDKIKKEKSKWINIATITAITTIITTLLLLYFKNSDSDYSSSCTTPNNYSDSNSSNNLFVNNNSNNTLINHNHNYIITDRDEIFESVTLQRPIEILGEKILQIIQNTDHFQLYNNTFLNHIDYLENECIYLKSNDINNFFIAIILEIIADELITKK